jgi:hypothetical protein
MSLSVTINQEEILSNGRAGQLENFINKLMKESRQKFNKHESKNIKNLKHINIK